MNERVKIYKVDSKGKLRFWYSWAENGFVNTVSGIVGREDTSSIKEQYLAKATNVGKKNERLSHAQARFEVDSLYKAKVEKKRYFYDIEQASNYISQDVQLAQDYTKKNNFKKIKWGEVDGQFKLDGVRCRITLDRQGGIFRVWSRENKTYTLPVTLYTEVLELFKAHPKLNRLDGELYCHGVDLEDIISMVKDVNNPDREQLEFWLYDTIEPTMTWLERKALINEVESTDYTRIRRLASVPLNSVEEARKYLDDAIELGYEGIILRNWAGLYLCGVRSYDLQKWKLFEDGEFKMTAVQRDKRGHGVGVFVTKDGKKFNARWKSSNAKRQHLADNPDKYIGRDWTVRYQRITAEGVPLFPVAIAPRDYE